MAGSPPVNDVPDLVSYHAGQGIRALWNGPKKLAESFVNLSYDYQLSWDELGFLSSNPNVDDGKNWKMVRPLGSGGFGMVGLWHAVDVDGNVVDEMAIKQTRSERSNDWSGNHPGLAKEAVLQYQLNQRNSENVVLLRRYKFYDEERKYRFYMEVCSHGELYRLRYRYRNWGTLLPELFLWHVFHSLAKVVALMDGPFNDFATGKPINQSYMLHMDLKHANIFLSEPASHTQDGETDPTSGYPIIKLGDFGLADITATGDPNNPQTFWGRGTVDYMPPEQRHFGVYWKDPPNFTVHPIDGNGQRVRMEPVRKNDPDPARYRRAEQAAQRAAENDNFHFSSSHNVWAVGKIMWDLMTLEEAHEFDTKLEDLSEDDYSGYPPDQWPGFDGYRAHAHYTEALMNLVSSCLRIERSDRPLPEELETGTHDGLRGAKEKAQESANCKQPATAPENVVYYRQNDINQMPHGGLNFTYFEGEWTRLVKSRFQDRAWDVLVPPSAFRRHAENAGTATKPIRPRVRPWRIENREMVFNLGQVVDGEMIFEEGDRGDQDEYSHMPYCNGDCLNTCNEAVTLLRQQRIEAARLDAEAFLARLASDALGIEPQSLQQQGQDEQQQQQPDGQPEDQPDDQLDHQQQAIVQSLPVQAPPIQSIQPQSIQQPHLPPPVQQPPVQQPLAQQTAVPAPAVQPVPLQADYEKLRIQDLTYELKFNRRVNCPNSLAKSTKAALVQLLMAQDALSNFGRGALKLAGPTYKDPKRKWRDAE